MQYRFCLPDGEKTLFDLAFDSPGFVLERNRVELLPDWTALEYHKCPNCVLDSADHPHCPLVASIAGLVDRFDGLLSHNDVRLEVVTEERCISQDTTAQRAISSLMGLLIATSGCPHTAFFRPMARFHLPLATAEETLYRVASMYALALYLRGTGGSPQALDLSGLSEAYERVHKVNVAVAKRLRAATTTDSSVNALVMLDVFAMDIPFTIDESLSEIRNLFPSDSDGC
jgi:hypothetical protein